MAVTSNTGSSLTALTLTGLTGFLCRSTHHPDEAANPARINRATGLTTVRRPKNASGDNARLATGRAPWTCGQPSLAQRACAPLGPHFLHQLLHPRPLSI